MASKLGQKTGSSSMKYMFSIETMKLLLRAFDWRQTREENGCVLVSTNHVPREMLSAH